MTSSDLATPSGLRVINTEGWAVRLAEPRDYGPIGDLLCEAYVAAGLEAPGGDYLPLMRDVAGRVADPRARVVVAVTSGTHGEEAVIGCVTLCGHGSGLTKVCLPGEFEFRMLGVDARWRRAGVAAALVNACDEVGADLGLTTSIGCAWEGNAAAMALYGRLGFSRLPERDHHYSPAEFLHVFGRQARFCGQCGRSPRIADHSRCEIAEKLEPPRFCQECRRRMKVQVLPTGWVARCSRHGELRG